MPILNFIRHSNIFQSYSSTDMEGKCGKCEWVTKHKCLECFARKCREDHDNYSEEEKLIGKCENCDGNQ